MTQTETIVTLDTYQALAMRTQNYALNPSSRFTMAVLGMVGEFQEGLDADNANDKAKELGDCHWYIAAACDAVGITYASVVMRSSLRTTIHEAQAAINRLAEYAKKWHYHSRPLTIEHIREIEALLIAATFDCGDAVRTANIRKLEHRYPNGFRPNDYSDRYEREAQ